MCFECFIRDIQWSGFLQFRFFAANCVRLPCNVTDVRCSLTLLLQRYTHTLQSCWAAMHKVRLNHALSFQR